MTRSWFLVLGGLTIAFVGGGITASRNGMGWSNNATNAAVPQPVAFAMPVPVTKVIQKTIPIELEYSARTEAIQNVTLQAKVTGYLLEQSVPDGADVQKGVRLYKIDPRDYQAALDQVQAQAQRDTAALDYARANSDRGNQLGKSGYLAKDTVEQRFSAVRQAEAALAIDRAAIEAAQLNLSNVEIQAPFAGRLGRNQASVGTLISIAGAPLNTLQQISPIYVTFNPSESDLAKIRKARDAAGDVRAEIFVSNDSPSIDTGKLTFIDNTLDRMTGTIVARATIDNIAKALLPGQYVRIRLSLGERSDALMIPQDALGSSQLGKYVYVVGQDNKAEQRIVSLGLTDGSLVQIVKGVSLGEAIINGNLQKIGPGTLVRPLGS